MVTGVLVVNIHKAAPNVHRRRGGTPLSYPKNMYDTALTALEKNAKQKTQESLLYNPRIYPRNQ